MIKLTKYCDLCKTHMPEPARDFTQEGGRVELNFRDVYSIDLLYRFDHCCIECAKALSGAVGEVVRKRRVL